MGCSAASGVCNGRRGRLGSTKQGQGGEAQYPKAEMFVEDDELVVLSVVDGLVRERPAPTNTVG